MMMFAAIGVLLVLLVGADLWLNRRRHVREERVRARMADRARRLQQDWDKRPR